MSREIIILTWGGVGDVLICTPTLRKLRQKFPGSKIIVYCKYAFHIPILKHNPNIDSLRTLTIKSLLRFPKHLFLYLFRRNKVNYYPLEFQRIPPPVAYNKSVKEIVPEIFNLELEPGQTDVDLYFTPKEEEKARKKLMNFKNVVLLHIYSTSSENHHWDMKNWKELVRQLPEYTFIQVGLETEKYVEGALDWRGKTGLREALCLLKYATSFVGVDSVFSHATNAFNLPGVVLFGDSSPVYWGHKNNINIYKAVRCSPCYYYLWGCDCPYDNRCMKLITVEDVKQALVKQVSSSSNRK